MEHVSVVFKHSFRGKYYKSIMNRSWVTKKFDFVFFCIFHRRHLKNGLGAARYHQIDTLVTLSYYKYIRAEINLFCHVCYNDRGLKIAKNAIRAIFVFVISGHNRQLSLILTLLLKRKLFVTNLLRFTTSKHIFNDEYQKCMTITSQFMEIPNFEIWQFSTAENCTMGLGRPFVQQLSQLTSHFLSELKPVCFVTFISTLAVSKQSIMQPGQFYNRN